MSAYLELFARELAHQLWRTLLGALLVGALWAWFEREQKRRLDAEISRIANVFKHAQ